MAIYEQKVQRESDSENSNTGRNKNDNILTQSFTLFLTSTSSPPTWESYSESIMCSCHQDRNQEMPHSVRLLQFGRKSVGEGSVSSKGSMNVMCGLEGIVVSAA